MRVRAWQQIPLMLGCIVAFLWGIECVNALLEHRLNRWGILPRTWAGLVGIPLSPFLHGSFTHLILNTVPLVTLGSFVAFYGVRLFVAVSLWITLLSGTALWLFGRSAYHVRASSVLFGYFGYLVARGWYERSVTALLVGLLTLVLYGSIVWGSCRHGPIFPGRVTCLGYSLACWWPGLAPLTACACATTSVVSYASLVLPCRVDQPLHCSTPGGNPRFGM